MKQLIFAILLFALSTSGKAQKFRLNMNAASVFDESFQYTLDPYNYYRGRIDGGLQTGAGLEYMVGPDYSVELTYLRHDTHAPTTYRAGASTYVKTTDFNFTLNYIMIGLNGYLVNHKDKLEVFGGVAQGVMILDVRNPVTGASSSSTKFAWSTKAGGNVWITHKIGIKLQSQFLLSIQSVGGDISSMRLKTISTFTQFNMGGGLTFKLGKLIR